MINPIAQYNTNSINNVSFKAIPLAKYGYLKEKGKEVIVYQIEKSDVEYIKHMK